jgi:rare lipoprotein A
MRLRAEAVFLALALAATPVQAAPSEQIGLASWYGDELRGKPTANGEPYNPDAMTAAHPTLPLGSFVEITALDTGRTVLVRVNDRGPYHGGRILDMSFGAARALGMTGHGARPIRIGRVFLSEYDAQAFRQGRVNAVRTPVPLSTLAAWRLRANWSAPIAFNRAIPPGNGPLWLQVGSFSSPTRAAAMAERLGATVSTVNGIHRVRIGPFADAARANAALAPLAAKGYPDVVIVR